MASPREIVRPDDPLSWDVAWKKNVTPWDAGRVQPSLREVIESSGINFPTSGKSLVPGCGTGYDVFYFAETLGLEGVGIDISETAVEAAHRKREETPSSIAEKTQFLLTNFFEYEVAEGERFDLALDHTFFVAIPPSQRPAWGRKMAELIKPGGYLITIVFPIEPFVEGGPPYFVRPEHYDGPLESFDKIHDKVPGISAPNHEGKERILVWKRK